MLSQSAENREEGEVREEGEYFKAINKPEEIQAPVAKEEQERVNEGAENKMI